MLRRSVGYLYLKAYLLSSLVTLFTATPLSSRLPARQRRKLLNLNQQAFAALPASSQPPPPRDVRPGSPRAWALLRAVQELEVRRSQQREQEEESDAAKAEHKRFRRWNTPSVKLSQRTTGADEVGVPEGEQPSGEARLSIGHPSYMLT